MPFFNLQFVYKIKKSFKQTIKSLIFAYNINNSNLRDSSFIGLFNVELLKHLLVAPHMEHFIVDLHTFASTIVMIYKFYSKSFVYKRDLSVF